MANFVITHNLKIPIVGRCNTEALYGEKDASITFCRADLWIHAGKTTKNEFTLGREGLSNISIERMKYHLSKDSLLTDLQEQGGYEIDDFIEVPTWRRSLKDQDIHFTNAVINNIFKKCDTTQMWFCKEWYLKELRDNTPFYNKKVTK